MTSLETSAADAEQLMNRPAPNAATSEWTDWANQTPQLRGLGIRCTDVRPDVGEFDVATVPYAPNPNGSVNGGMLAAIADNAMGVLTARACPPGYLAATSSLHIQFHKPARAPLHISARMLPGGNRVKFVEVVLRDADGNHCATAQGTMIVGGAGRPQAGDQSGDQPGDPSDE